MPRDLTDTLARVGVTTPFPIQAAALPDAMSGRDLCGRAPTGSGKTLTFSIPLALRATAASAHRPTALVLVPTRELAAQVADVLEPLARARGRSVATFYGGTKIARDQRRLRSGVDIAIACPGRLADLVQRRDVHLGEVRTVVLDEADRMADMGFLPEVTRLLDRTADDRQTLLFSATLDGDVDVLVRRYQRDPARHATPSEGDERGDVRHFFWSAVKSERIEIARDIVRTIAPAIVFTRTKHGADRLTRQLNRQGVRAAAIHGNRSQNQRERALADLTRGEVAALVATDVAARGIHVDNVGVVLHYDPPGTDKDYVHRSGRTGRAGADGVVVTLVTPDTSADVRSMQRKLAMREQIETSDLRDLRDPSAGQRDGGPEPGPAPSRRASGRSQPTARSDGRGSQSRNGGAGRDGQRRRGGQRRSPNARGRSNARGDQRRTHTS
ncbi:MAG: DEAD/DEAH box helicase [Actinobacteria bacterium]|nr:DEAD/DEAH box helicase [Actinomycetota bacterium]